MAQNQERLQIVSDLQKKVKSTVTCNRDFETRSAAYYSIKRIKMLDGLDERLKAMIDSVTQNGGDYLIKPRRDLTPVQLFRMYDNLKALGGKYSPVTHTFTLPAEAFLSPSVKAALVLLRGVFGPSQNEIKKSVETLVTAGMGPEEISSETGASKATVYRYMQRQPNAHGFSSETAQPNAMKV